MTELVKGKSFDSFGPVGPYLVTRDDIKNVQNLMFLRVMLGAAIL